MDAHPVVELDDALVGLGSVEETTAHSEDVTVRAPLARLDQHSSVDDHASFISERLHQLHSTTSVGDAQLVAAFIHVFIRKALLI